MICSPGTRREGVQKKEKRSFFGKGERGLGITIYRGEKKLIKERPPIRGGGNPKNTRLQCKNRFAPRRKVK